MKKGQVWYSDFIIGVLIFSVVVITYFYYTEHQGPGEDELMNSLISESKAISGSLMSKGYPEEWGPGNVTTIGLIDENNRIDLDKMSDFSSMDQNDRRDKLHTTKQFYFYMQYLNGTKFNQVCEDSPACVEWNTTSYMVQNTRLAIYNSDIVKVVIYVYQKT